MNKDRQIQLIDRLKQARDFLDRNVEQQPVYRDLIAVLESIGDRLDSSAIVVKIVSPSSALAESLRVKHEANECLRSLYEFEAVSPISQIQQILRDCDLICLVYDQKHRIREHHYKLIELARKQGIDLQVMVHRSLSNTDENDCDWQQDLDALVNSLLPLPFDYFIDLDRPEELNLYQRSLIDLVTVLSNNLSLRIEHNIVREVKSFFNQEITSSWQAIKQINTQYFAGEPLHLYEQKFRQNNQALSQFRQQLIRDIKQDINHEKTDLLNPFTVDSLIFELQQLINSSQARIVTETEQTYLYLALTDFPEQPLLHDYVLKLCQQRVNKIIIDQHQKISCEYGNGGLKGLVERSNRQLNQVEPLLNSEFKTIEQPISNKLTLNLEEIIDIYCLNVGSRIAFDYNFAQSSWFRLLVSALVGTAIYVSTWLYLGTGKYIGFMIIIFQIINLITGQNIKKARLKQQTKELKRIVDQKCQSLVRTMVSYIAQTSIVSVDRECQFYESQYSQTIAIAQSKLAKLKHTNEEHRSSINKLKQDRDKIIAWFE